MLYKCSICTKEFSEDGFYKTGKYRRKYCKFCEHKRKTRDTRNKKLQIVKLLGGKCIQCGYDKCIYALDIDHLDPLLKKFNLSEGTHSYAMYKLLEEIKNCQLLCANCHREKTFKEYG